MKKNLFFIFCAFCLFTNTVKAQIITTIAGSDTASALGDGGLAIHAFIQAPFAVAMDAVGNIYIADQYNSRVRKVTTTGVISTIAGNGGAGFFGDGGHATAAELNWPSGVAVDAAGNVYISDMNNDCIRKVNTAGMISTYAGVGLNPGYNGDGGLAVATSARLHTPMGISVDAAGNLYIAEYDNSVIRKVATTGILSTVCGIGAGGFSGDGGAATNALLNQPSDVKIDAAGNLFIADMYNNRIRKVNTLGVISTIAGKDTAGYSGDGGLATNAKLNKPTGVAVNANGVLYITDCFNNRIRNVYPTGVIYTLAGNGTAGYSGDGGLAHYAKMYNPRGGVLNTAGYYLFADFDNNVVRKTASFVNHLPTFIGGNIQSINVCTDSTANPINTIMAIAELDTTQTENWTIVHSPTHGTITASYTAVSTGSNITPTGLAYTPTTGYVGMDTFKICVSDGIGFDTTTVYVTVQLPLTTAGAISGADSVCQADTIILTPSIAGGMWSSSNTSITTITPTTGIVTGVAASGTDTIIYNLSNACNNALAFYTVYIRPHTICALNSGGVAATNDNEIRVYPNPNSGMFTINLTSITDEPITITITNLIGEKIKEITTTTNQATDIKLYAPSGIYLLTATTQHNSYSARLNIIR